MGCLHTNRDGPLVIPCAILPASAVPLDWCHRAAAELRGTALGSGVEVPSVRWLDLERAGLRIPTRGGFFDWLDVALRAERPAGSGR